MSRLTALLGMFAMSLAVLLAMWPLVAKEGRGVIDAALLPYRIAVMVGEPADETLMIPVEGVRTRDIADTYEEPRGEERTHEGQDIFAARGTPVHPATTGYVMRAGENRLGGFVVFVLGQGGRGYYYAHLDSHGPDAKIGTLVTEDDVTGYVGTTGNATGTPPHLHFGIYTREGTMNPLPLLVDQ